jgi:hypothetical protein
MSLQTTHFLYYEIYSTKNSRKNALFHILLLFLISLTLRLSFRFSLNYCLFGTQNVFVKEANFDSIGKYFVSRLKTIFAGVAENPLPLRNSKNVPIFLLCFAASNPKGASTAVKIAQDILKQ